MEEFKLPENWYLKSCPELKDLLNPSTNIIGDHNNNCYSHSHKELIGNAYLISMDWKVLKVFELRDYTEITVKQFKQYVLKETPISNDLTYLIDLLTKLNIT